MTDRFIVGPAVDEAAEGMNCAHGALVWLAPSADAFEQPQNWWSHYPLMRYDVPTKTSEGLSQRTALVVVPLTAGRELEELSAAYAATFVPADPGNRKLAADVEQKKENTLAFLRCAAEREWPASYDPEARALDPYRPPSR